MKNILCVSLLLTAGSLQAMNKKEKLDKIRPAASPNEIKEIHQRLLNGKVGFERIRMAVTLSDTAEVKRLLNEEKRALETIKYDSKINRLESDETLLYIAASNGDLEIVELLINEGANVNIGNNHNSTPLHTAVYCKNPAVVALLLEKKANPNACSNNGYTPLHNAVKWFFEEIGNEFHMNEIIELLLAHGANATIIGKSPLCVLLEYCDKTKGHGEYEKSDELKALFNKYPHCKRLMNTNNQ